MKYLFDLIINYLKYLLHVFPKGERDFPKGECDFSKRECNFPKGECDFHDLDRVFLKTILKKYFK